MIDTICDQLRLLRKRLMTRDEGDGHYVYVKNLRGDRVGVMLVKPFPSVQTRTFRCLVQMRSTATMPRQSAEIV